MELKWEVKLEVRLMKKFVVATWVGSELPCQISAKTIHKGSCVSTHEGQKNLNIVVSAKC